MAADGTITLDIDVNERGLQQGLNKAGNSIKSALGGIGKALAGIFAISKIMEFVKACTDMASDVQEVQNVVDTAFGDMKQDMEDFADTAIEKFGISALTAKRTGSTFMSMAVGMGLVGEDASKMSLNLTALSADMASFYNQSQDMTALALNSVFTGETETLKRYGIVMTQVNLEEYARTKGITKSIQAMTQQEQTLLRYNYVMEQTRLAQGDFAKTGDSWANQTRKLSENFKNLQVEFGKAFVQIGTLFVPILNKIIEGLTVIAQLAQKAANWIAVMITGEELQTDTSEQIAQSVENQEELTKAVEDTNKALKNSTASFFEINKISQASGTAKKADTGAGFSLGIADYNEQEVQTVTDHISERLIGAFNSVKKWIDKNFGKTFEKIAEDAKKNFTKTAESTKKLFNLGKEYLPDVKKWFDDEMTPAINDVIGAGGHIFDGVWDSFNNVYEFWVEKIMPIFMETATSAILPSFSTTLSRAARLLRKIFDNIKKIADRVANTLKPILEKVAEIWSGIVKDWNKWWQGEDGEKASKGVEDVVDGLGESITMLWDDIVTPFFEWLETRMQPFYDEHIKPMMDELQSFITKMGGWLSTIWLWVKALVYAVKEKFGPLILEVAKLFWNVLEFIGGLLADSFTAFFKLCGGVIEFLTGVFTGDWKMAWHGILEILRGIWDGMYAIIKNVGNLIIDAINFLLQSSFKQVQAIGNKIGELLEKTTGKKYEITDDMLPQIPHLPESVVPELKKTAETTAKAAKEISDIVPGYKAITKATNEASKEMTGVIPGYEAIAEATKKASTEMTSVIPGYTAISKAANKANTELSSLIPGVATGAVLPASTSFLSVTDSQKGATIEDFMQTGGGNATIISMLNQILTAVQKGHNIYMDGELVAQAIDSTNATNAIRGGTMVSY